MESSQYTIRDLLGIHARPAGQLVKLLSLHAGKVTIQCAGKSADARRLFGIMGMGIKQGDQVNIEVAGSDERAVCQVLRGFFEETL